VLTADKALNQSPKHLVERRLISDEGGPHAPRGTSMINPVAQDIFNHTVASCSFIAVISTTRGRNCRARQELPGQTCRLQIW
jgi:hypothetical protein